MKKPRKIIKVGYAGVSNQHGFTYFRRGAHHEISKKDTADMFKEFIRANVSKAQLKTIMKVPDRHFGFFSYIGCVAYWRLRDFEFVNDEEKAYSKSLDEYIAKLTKMGEQIADTEIPVEEIKARKNPHELMREKVNQTILRDIDDLEESWMTGEKFDLDIIALMKEYDLKGVSVGIVIQSLLDLKEPLLSTDEQDREAMAHIKPREKNRRVKMIDGYISDLEGFKGMVKATRTTVKKPKSVMKQIEKMKFQKENIEYQLASISPAAVIGKTRLFTFNTKTRRFSEYLSTSGKGFLISGTSLKNFDPELSLQTVLRKPKEFIQVVLKKTPTQISKEIKGLTTKLSTPNGRMNEDTILLRVLDK